MRASLTVIMVAACGSPAVVPAVVSITPDAGAIATPDTPDSAVVAPPFAKPPGALSLGERATLGDWEVQWVDVRDGYFVLEGTSRKRSQQDAGASLGQRDFIERWKVVLAAPEHELKSPDGLFHLDVLLTAVNGEGERANISLTLTPVDHAASATFGQPLDPGLYVFPDGLRFRVDHVYDCDFDTRVPCYGGTYHAVALSRGQEASVEWSTRTTTLLGRKLELSNYHVIVSQ